MLDSDQTVAKAVSDGLPPFESPQGGRLRDALIGLSESGCIDPILDHAEASWQVAWLTWIDHNVVARFWEEDDLVARWLCHEIAFGDVDRARSLAVLLGSYPPDRERSALVFEALARHAYFVGNISEGDIRMADIEDIDPDYDPFWCHLARLGGLRDNGDDAVLDQSNMLTRIYPGDARLFSVLLPIYADLGETEAIIKMVKDFGGPHKIESSYPAYLYFSALELSGQLRVAFDEVQLYLTVFPENYPVYHILRSVAHRLDRLDEVHHIFDLSATSWDQPEGREIAIMRALDGDDYTKATSLLAGFSDPHCQPALRARLTIATTMPRSSDAMDAFQTYRESGVRHVGPEIQIVSHLFGRARSKRDLRQLLDLLKAQLDLGRTNIMFQRLWLQLLVALEQYDDAQVWFDKLPNGMKKNWYLAEVAHFLAQRNGDHANVDAAWVTRTEVADYRVLRNTSAHPTPVRVSNTALPPGVIVFSCFYNGLEYIDWFLAHYRDLGVLSFVIVDNGSTDGTLEYLMVQSDVRVFSQPDSFKEAGHGVAWINHLISKYALDRWVLFVDMDERLVFPQLEQGRTLDELTQYGDAHGFGAFSSFMLDVFAPIWSRNADKFDAQTHFDNDYFSFPSITPPYRCVQGGLRARMTGRQFLITKSPLVKTRPGFAFLENNHSHTHLPVADVGTVLLHYKLIGDASQRIEDAIERREHYMAGRLYRDLQLNIAGRGIMPSLKTRRYRGPAQLVQLGLMPSTDAWDRWT